MPRRTEPEAFALRVGGRIRELRFERGLSLGALADLTGVSKGHLSSVEHGLASITVGTVARIAEGLNVPPMYLLAFPADDERAHAAELLRFVPRTEVKRIVRQIESMTKR